MPLAALAGPPDTPFLSLLRVLLLYNTYDYHTMILYITRAQHLADMSTDILDIVHRSSLALRVFNYETYTGSFRVKRNTFHLNVVLIPSAMSLSRLSTIDVNFLSHDDHFFLVQFTELSNSYIYQEIYTHLGLHRTILFHRDQVITLNRYRDYAITRINATAAMSTDADITKFAQHHVWENDGGSEMNLFGHEITIFMKILPYLSIAVRVPDEDGGTQTLIVGPDGFVAQEMVRKMRARSIFMCDQLLESPQYNVWYRHNAFLRRGETVIHSFPNILTENVMTSNRYSELGEFELYMTAMFLREPDMELADVDHTYPHGHSCMRVLVPRSQLKFSMLSRMVGHRSVRAVVMLALGFAVARPALLLERRPVWWLVEMLQALGVFLAQVDVKRRVMRWPETVWVLAVLPFSVIGVALFAASFYTILIAQDVRVDIDTVGQLLAANLTVFAPYYIDNGTWERAMVPLLQFTSIGRIDEMIMLAMNTSVAFALEESRADYFVQMHRHQMSGQELKFHLMREPLFCGLSTYRLPFNSPLQLSANRVVTMINESGLYAIYRRWTMDFVRAMFVRPPSNNREKKPIAWLDVNGVFVALLFMLGLAALILLAECATKRVVLRRTRRRRLALRRPMRFDGRKFG